MHYTRRNTLCSEPIEKSIHNGFIKMQFIARNSYMQNVLRNSNVKNSNINRIPNS